MIIIIVFIRNILNHPHKMNLLLYKIKIVLFNVIPMFKLGLLT